MHPIPVLRRALRRLHRAPAFSLSALLTLALGVGAASAVFAVVDAVLLRPLPYRDSGRLVDLSHTLAISGLTRVNQSDATFLVYRDRNRVFSDVAAYRPVAVNFRPDAGSDVGRGAAPERLPAAVASAGLFPVLGVAPLRGRAFTARDEAPGAAPVVIVGEALWRTTLGSDPAILGRRVTVDGVTREVVGVMPAGFAFPDARTALWVPLSIDPLDLHTAAFDYRGVARLRPEISPARATADLQRLLPRVPEIYPGRLTAGAITATHMQAVARPLRDVVVGDVGPVLWIALGAVAVLLLLACANVANLFLARAEARRRDLAVRRALGAARAELFGETLAEALVLAAGAGVLGLGLAALIVRLLPVLPAAASIPRLAELRVDTVVAGVCLAVATLAGLAASLLATLRSSAVSVATLLQADSRSATVGRGRSLARRGLVVLQVALAVVLVAGAGLLVRSFAGLRAVDPGFTTAGALAFRVAPGQASYPVAGDVARLVAPALDSLRALPGVRAAGAVSKLPLEEESRQDSAVYVEDHPTPPGAIPGIHPIVFATPGYFRAMGIPLLEGRLFQPSDASGDATRTPREVVVSRAFAGRYWNGESAVGRRIRMDPRDPWSTVVGVVGGVRDERLDGEAAQTVYVPLLTVGPTGVASAPRDLAFVIRADGGAGALAAPIRATMRRLAPALPVYDLRPLDALLAGATARTSFTLLLLAVAAAIALAIGALGIYAVISYLVSLRTREIGVRLALGAAPGDVRRLVVRRGITDAALGVAAGLVGATALSGSLGGLLFGVAPADPASLAAAALVLLTTAAVAAWLPARRAAALDPVRAMRSE